MCEELNKPEEQTTRPTYYYKLYGCDTHTKADDKHKLILLKGVYNSDE